MSSDNNHKFITVFDCMDGPCQRKVLQFVDAEYGSDCEPDTITEPGLDKVLAGGLHAVASADFLPRLREWVRTKAGVSANGHGSREALIVGHCGCAGNPVSYAEHLAHLHAARTTVQDWDLFPNGVRVLAFNDRWELREIADADMKNAAMPAAQSSARETAAAV